MSDTKKPVLDTELARTLYDLVVEVRDLRAKVLHLTTIIERQQDDGK